MSLVGVGTVVSVFVFDGDPERQVFEGSLAGFRSTVSAFGSVGAHSEFGIRLATVIHDRNAAVPFGAEVNCDRGCPESAILKESSCDRNARERDDN
jgi:hypothetical protein